MAPFNMRYDILAILLHNIYLCMRSSQQVLKVHIIEKKVFFFLCLVSVPEWGVSRKKVKTFHHAICFHASSPA